MRTVVIRVRPRSLTILRLLRDAWGLRSYDDVISRLADSNRLEEVRTEMARIEQEVGHHDE